MTFNDTARAPAKLQTLTDDWGSDDSVSLYLERCQVDTPDALVDLVWDHVKQYREEIGSVVDFGAGDGRFGKTGNYKKYVGYEIDASRSSAKAKGLKIINKCAFDSEISDADLAIGNPPFVRNQDLPPGWRDRAASVLLDRTGVRLSGLANAWQYFFLLSLSSLREDGLCAIVIPYEWVSRPSASVIRDYIRSAKWNVDVYRLVDEVFPSVLTTASITIVDKRRSKGRWRFFEETASGKFRKLSSETASKEGVLGYRRQRSCSELPFVKRGLSPGTQKVLVLTEGERVANGLRRGRDVVPCVTSLKPLSADIPCLNEDVFQAFYRLRGHKCWLIRTDRTPSAALAGYLDSIPSTDYQTQTCLQREVWWKYTMPAVPDALISQTFKARFPKSVRNDLGARPVGGVSGIYNASSSQIDDICTGLHGLNLADRVVSYANGLKKIEINQLNWVFDQYFSGELSRDR